MIRQNRVHLKNLYRCCDENQSFPLTKSPCKNLGFHAEQSISYRFVLVGIILFFITPVVLGCGMGPDRADESIGSFATQGSLKKSVSVVENSRASQDTTLFPNNVLPNQIEQTSQSRLNYSIQAREVERLGAGRSHQITTTPQGDLLAVATPLGLYLYNPESLQQAEFFPTEQPISRMAFSPDGSMLALNYTSTPLVELWDVDSGQILHRLTTATNVTRQLHFSPDGSMLGVITLDNIYLWQWQNNRSLPLLESDRPDTPIIIKSIAFSPNGQRLALAFINQIELWDLVEPKPLAVDATDEQISFNVDTLTFSNDGSQLAAGAWSEKRIHLWQVGGDNHLSRVEEQFLLLGSGRSQVTELIFLPDEQIVVAGLADGSLHWLDLVRGEHQSLASGLGPIRSLVWNNAKSFVVAGGNQGTLYVWHPHKEIATPQLGISIDGPLADMRYSALIAQDRVLLTERSDGLIQQWDLESQAISAELPHHSLNQVNSIAFSPNDGTIGIGLESGAVLLWRDREGEVRSDIGDKTRDESRSKASEKAIDAPTGGSIRSLAQGIGSVDTVTFSKDGRYLATAIAKPVSYGKWDDTVYLWRHGDGSLLHTLHIPYEETVGCGIFHNSVAFSSDGSILATVSYAHKVHLWDVTTGLLTQTLEGHESGVLAVAFSPDGRFVASASDDQKVIVWQVSNGVEYLRIPEHIGGATSVGFSPDGHFLATGSATGQVILWRLVDGQRSAVLSPNKSRWSDIAFSPDGMFIAIGTKSGQVEIWRVEDGRRLHQFSAHRGSINTIQFDTVGSSSTGSNRIGSTLVTGGSDGTVAFWVLDKIP